MTRKTLLTVTTLADRNATVAQVEWLNTTVGHVALATGSAKREPGDSHDEITAEMLAVSRALCKIAASMERTARDRVAKAEEVKRAEKQRLKDKGLRRIAADRKSKRRSTQRRTPVTKGARRGTANA